MPKDKLKTIYVCNQCGETSPRWMGRCPSCGAWNTMTEDVVAEPTKSGSRAAAPVRVTGQTSLKPQKLKNISTTEEKSRIVTGISELDRVLGGFAARSAKPKTCSMSRARNRCGRSNSALCV